MFKLLIYLSFGKFWLIMERLKFLVVQRIVESSINFKLLENYELLRRLRQKGLKLLMVLRNIGTFSKFHGNIREKMKKKKAKKEKKKGEAIFFRGSHDS